MNESTSGARKRKRQVGQLPYKLWIGRANYTFCPINIS